MQPRREILRSCLRCGGLLALGGVAAALGWRGRHDRCPRRNPCAGCPVFAACGLPEALDAKRLNTPVAHPAGVKPASGHV